MVTETTRPWEAPGYSDVLAAERVGGDLRVEFANGDVVIISAARFGVNEDFSVAFDADRLPSVKLVTASSVRDISWAQVRAVSDPEFAQEMRRQDSEESKRIGRRLRALREDRGLTQRDLAKLVGMAPPQLSKIESGAFDLRVSTVQSLLRAMGATFSDIAGPEALEFSQKALRRKAQDASAPPDLIERLISSVPRQKLPRLLSRAFGWDLDSGDLIAAPSAADTGLRFAFKALKTSHDPASSPLVHLAVTCSAITLRASEPTPAMELPRASELRIRASDVDGLVTLTSLTNWAWSAGIAVIPLHGRGAFCAAAWTLENHPVVVLKDSRASAVFWLFDLAHELGHLALGHVTGEGIIDVEQLAPDHNVTDVEEREANQYALELLLGDSDALVDEVRRESRGNYLRFKGAVATVANRANVSPGLLGMVAAYELTDIGQAKDRWGSATNLAAPDGEGRPQIVRALQGRIELERLPAEDATLLSAAVLSD